MVSHLLLSVKLLFFTVVNIHFILKKILALDFFTKSLSGWPCEWSHAAMRRLVAVGAAQNVLQATYTDTGLGKCRLEVYTQSSSGNHILGSFHRSLVRRKRRLMRSVFKGGNQPSKANQLFYFPNPNLPMPNNYSEVNIS